jgi:dienelactone hydrolase
VPIQTFANVITQSLTSTEQISIQNAVVNGKGPLTSTELAALSPAARAAYHLLQGDDPQHVDENIAVLPEETRQQLQTLSPARVLDQIAAPIFLLHDSNDHSLPVTGSRDFAAALARQHHFYDYVELHIFDHVQVRSHFEVAQELGDASHLFAILDQLYLLSTR